VGGHNDDQCATRCHMPESFVTRRGVISALVGCALVKREKWSSLGEIGSIPLKRHENSPAVVPVAQR